MQVLYGPGDSVKDGAGFSLWEELLLEDPIQQLPSAHQLRHQEHLLTVVVHLRRQRLQADFKLSITIATLATSFFFFFFTHVLQRYDIRVLSISKQNLDLFRRIRAGLVNHLLIPQRKVVTRALKKYNLFHWGSFIRLRTLTAYSVLVVLWTQRLQTEKEPMPMSSFST